MKAYVFIALGILLLLYILYYRTHPLTSKVRIRGRVIDVDVAVGMFEQARGLGGRKTMASNRGMLFIYDHKEQYNFWMMGMKFPLDFIWIDGKRVADLTLDVPPPKAFTTPAMVKPKVPVDKILEVNAGVVDRLGIKIGDTVEFLDK